MSADGDIVRLALHGDEISARAALVRLEAAAASNRFLAETLDAQTMNAARYAEALRRIRDTPSRDWHLNARIARAALAETGLE